LYGTSRALFNLRDYSVGLENTSSGNKFFQKLYSRTLTAIVKDVVALRGLLAEDLCISFEKQYPAFLVTIAE